LLLILNAVVLTAAALAVRRWTGDPVQRWIDTLLIWFAVQYVSVCLPGVLHILSVWTMAGTALLLSGGMLWIGKNLKSEISDLKAAQPSRSGANIVYWTAGAFVAAVIVGVVYEQNLLPLIDSDAMTYHAPAVVHWLQSGRLGLLPVWFFNPANTFSPLGGSTFIAWLMAPLEGDDVLARAVQGPPLFLLFLAMVQVGRGVGLSPIVAALLAAAAAVSRPFSSEIMAPRDDVFLAAFIGAAVAGCSSQALRDRVGAVRIGLALGLAAATKYTFLFAAPALLLVVDAPVRAGWTRRQWLIAAGMALVVAGPWYLRNLLLTGNPLYPVRVTAFGHAILPGLFEPLRSMRLRTLAGMRGAVVGGAAHEGAFHGPPAGLFWLLVIGWVAAVALRWREALRVPLMRACVLGLPLCLGLFLLKAPYAEVRFVFPALGLLFVAAGLALSSRPWLYMVNIAFAAVLLAVSVWTSYEYKVGISQIASSAIVVAALAAGIAVVNRRWGSGGGSRVIAYEALAGLLLLSQQIYVYWPSYVKGYGETKPQFWKTQYIGFAEAWKYVNENVPATATLAYANTYLLYPLYGTPPTRRLLYVPVRRDVTDFLHLPVFPHPVPGEEVDKTASELLCEKPDHDIWLRRLLDSRADYLFIARGQAVTDPPELGFTTDDPQHFTQVYSDDGAVIYQVNRK
jgi:hypothetical protein